MRRQHAQVVCHRGERPALGPWAARCELNQELRNADIVEGDKRTAAAAFALALVVRPRPVREVAALGDRGSVPRRGLDPPSLEPEELLAPGLRRRLLA